MKRGELLGSLEYIILLALVRLDEEARGMNVRREVEEHTGRNISIGAGYATLERLEAKGYVSSVRGEPTPERGGWAKRMFRVEAAGKRAATKTVGERYEGLRTSPLATAPGAGNHGRTVLACGPFLPAFRQADSCSYFETRKGSAQNAVLMKIDLPSVFGSQ